MSNVGARTSTRRGPAMFGRPPRETMAAMSASGSAAAHSAPPAPVLAPNQPMRSSRAHGWTRSQAVTWVSRPASSSMSNTLARSASSSGGEQVEQQRAEAGLDEHGGDETVSRTVSATAATVHKHHNARGVLRQRHMPRQVERPGANQDLLVPAGPRVTRFRLRGRRAGQQITDLLVRGREKSSYHSPIEDSQMGVSTQITSSASARSSPTRSAAATGTARITRMAPRARATWQAVRAVEPVATRRRRSAPSVPPGRPRAGRHAAGPPAGSDRLLPGLDAANSSALTSARRTTRGLMIRTPPSPMAPIPSSGWSGTPSLRITITSSGACSAWATSNATGTPPRGNPSTTTSCPRRWLTRRESSRPASTRSRTSWSSPSEPDSPDRLAWPSANPMSGA